MGTGEEPCGGASELSFTVVPSCLLKRAWPPEIGFWSLSPTEKNQGSLEKLRSGHKVTYKMGLDHLVAESKSSQTNRTVKGIQERGSHRTIGKASSIRKNDGNSIIR